MGKGFYGWRYGGRIEWGGWLCRMFACEQRAMDEIEEAGGIALVADGKKTGELKPGWL